MFLCCREAFRVMELQESGGRNIHMGSNSQLAIYPTHKTHRYGMEM